MSFWRWDDGSKFGTFEKEPLKDGALKDALIDMASGTSPVTAVLKAATRGDKVMEESKSLFLSKSFWGLVATVAAPFLAKFGIVDTNGLAESAVALAGAVFGIYGIVTRKGAVHVVPPK